MVSNPRGMEADAALLARHSAVRFVAAMLAVIEPARGATSCTATRGGGGGRGKGATLVAVHSHEISPLAKAARSVTACTRM